MRNHPFDKAEEPEQPEGIRIDQQRQIEVLERDLQQFSRMMVQWERYIREREAGPLPEGYEAAGSQQVLPYMTDLSLLLEIKRHGCPIAFVNNPEGQLDIAYPEDVADEMRQTVATLHEKFSDDGAAVERISELVGAYDDIYAHDMSPFMNLPASLEPRRPDIYMAAVLVHLLGKERVAWDIADGILDRYSTFAQTVDENEVAQYHPLGLEEFQGYYLTDLRAFFARHPDYNERLHLDRPIEDPILHDPHGVDD